MVTYIHLMILCSLLVLQPSISLGAQGEDMLARERIVIGFYPAASASLLHSRSEPLFAFLNSAASFPVRMRLSRNYAAFVADAKEGRMQVAYAPPHLAGFLISHHGFIPLATGGDPLRVVLYTVDGSGLTDLKDLKGETVATPDELSLNSLIVRQAIEESGLEIGTDVFIHSHVTQEEVILDMLKNEYRIAAGSSVMLSFLSGTLKEQVYFAWESALQPPDIFLANPHLAQDRLEEIQALLLRFGNTTEGKAHFESMPSIEPFGEVTADLLLQLKELSSLVEMKLGVNSDQK